MTKRRIVCCAARVFIVLFCSLVVRLLFLSFWTTYGFAPRGQGFVLRGQNTTGFAPRAQGFAPRAQTVGQRGTPQRCTGLRPEDTDG